jgi:hypothetical protein
MYSTQLSESPQTLRWRWGRYRGRLRSPCTSATTLLGRQLRRRSPRSRCPCTSRPSRTRAGSTRVDAGHARRHRGGALRGIADAAQRRSGAQSSIQQSQRDALRDAAESVGFRISHLCAARCRGVDRARAIRDRGRRCIENGADSREQREGAATRATHHGCGNEWNVRRGGVVIHSGAGECHITISTYRSCRLAISAWDIRSFHHSIGQSQREHSSPGEWNCFSREIWGISTSKSGTKSSLYSQFLSLVDQRANASIWGMRSHLADASRTRSRHTF